MSSMNEDKRRLLIVEDDLGLQRQLKWCFDEYDLQIAASRTEAVAQLRRFEPPVVLLDLGLPPDAEGVAEGIAALQEILRLAPYTKIIVVTGNHDRDNAVRAVAMGAYDFCNKPVDAGVLQLIVRRAFHMHVLEQQNRQLQQSQFAFEGLVASDESMTRVCNALRKVAPTDVSLLIVGESGTGKELLARAAHSLSERRAGRFVAVNCAALPEATLERELFGAERVPGMIEAAGQGTLYLDEIGDLPLPLQSKLLHFLEAGQIERADGSRHPVDARIICATQHDLRQRIDAGAFRQDLYSRLSEVVIEVPPLRERPGAPSVLAHYLLRKYGGIHGRPRRGFTEAALAALEAHTWPGNVRELENRVKTAVIAASGALLTPADLNLTDTATGALFFNLKEVRTRAERQAIQQALSITDGNISKTAELLGVSRPTLYDLLEKYGIRNAQ